MSKRKPNWIDREKMILMEEYEKRKDVLRAKFSSTITSSTKNTAWDEITEAMNPPKSTCKKEHERNLKDFFFHFGNSTHFSTSIYVCKLKFVSYFYYIKWTYFI
jgi:hypothetical protein